MVQWLTVDDPKFPHDSESFISGLTSILKSRHFLFRNSDLVNCTFITGFTILFFFSEYGNIKTFHVSFDTNSKFIIHLAPVCGRFTTAETNRRRLPGTLVRWIYQLYKFAPNNMEGNISRRMLCTLFCLLRSYGANHPKHFNFRIGMVDCLNVSVSRIFCGPVCPNKDDLGKNRQIYVAWA